MTTFSIIMCNYNNAHYIREALESVLAQTFQDWELTLIDDCSTDNSMEIIKEYEKKDERIKVFINEKNLGYGKSIARNVEISTGKYGAILDPDDALEPDALETMYHTFLKNKDIVGAYSQMYYCDQNLKPQKVFEHSRAIPKGTTYLEYGKLAMTHFFCFDRQKFLDYGNVDNKFRNALDQDWYYKVEEIGKVFFVEKPLYYYRVSPTGLSQGRKKRWITQVDHLAIKMKAIERRGITGKRKEKILKPTILEILYFKTMYLKEEKKLAYIPSLIQLYAKKFLYKIKGL